ncbi:hypothetical protein [Frankia tisae]|uniref:hypothetical protein n=1 Tax=Frankia tisae TaxID=2950104 RepID=UPI0021C0BFF2|nr:hypothetical protein [Frankia tisae]
MAQRDNQSQHGRQRNRSLHGEPPGGAHAGRAVAEQLAVAHHERADAAPAGPGECRERADVPVAVDQHAVGP